MTSYMLALGSHVISAEPAADLAAAIRATATTLNCWSDRSVVVDRFACALVNNGATTDALAPMAGQARLATVLVAHPKLGGARLPRSGSRAERTFAW